MRRAARVPNREVHNNSGHPLMLSVGRAAGDLICIVKTGPDKSGSTDSLFSTASLPFYVNISVLGH